MRRGRGKVRKEDKIEEERRNKNSEEEKRMRKIEKKR